MKTVYFVRHGQAVNNAPPPGSICYGSEAPLTEHGIKQAEMIAERVSHVPTQVIISSPFKRTVQTTEIIGKRVKEPVEYSDLFVERQGPTRLVGQLWDDPQVQKIQRSWERSFYTDTRIEDGETFSEIRLRSRAAREFLESRSESNILVVTHGFFLRIFIADMILGDNFSPRLLESLDRRMRTMNTGLTMVTHVPSDTHAPWRLETWNDHAHLG